MLQGAGDNCAAAAEARKDPASKVIEWHEGMQQDVKEKKQEVTKCRVRPAISSSVARV